MNQRRVSLDNPSFEGRLRHVSRSSAYVPRTVPRHAEASSMPVSFQPPVAQAVPTEPTNSNTVPASSALPRVREIHTFEPPEKYKKQTFRQKFAIRPKQFSVLYAMAAVIFVIGLTVSLNGMRANRQVAAQVEHLASTSNTDSANDNGGHPSVVKPSADDTASYTVAPNLPKYIDISKLGVHARVLSMGVTSSNQLKAPGNVFDAGWYNASAQPGQPGGMLMDGHISSWTAKGVFYGLNKLATGDQITITRGDDKTFTYTVVKTQLYDASSVDMKSMLVSQDPAKPGLNLISCSGEVIPGTNEFNKRQVVYAVME